MLLIDQNKRLQDALFTAILLNILVPNFPGFIPGGDIKPLWILMSMIVVGFYPKKNFFKWVVLLAAISYPFLFKSISFKYLVVVFIPCFVFYSYPVFLHLKKSLNFLSIFVIIVGCMSILNIVILNPLFSFFLGDGSGVSVEDNIRGCGLIATEPSHLAPLLMLMVASLRHIKDKKSFLIILTGASMGILITGSGSVLLYLAVYGLLVMASCLNIKTFLLISTFIFVFALSGLPLRFIQIINNVIDLSNVGLSLDWTARVAAGRFIANYVWITDIINHPFGHGFGLEKQIALHRLYELGIDPNVMGAYSRFGEDGLPIMPRSFLTAIVAISGYFGLIILITFGYLFCKRNKITDIPLFGVGLVYLVFVGFVGSPYGWIFLMLSVNRNLESLLNNCNSNSWISA